MSFDVRILVLGAAIGAAGMGIQNINPFEPRVCTGVCAILFGIFIITWLIAYEICLIIIDEFKAKKEAKGE